VVPWSEWRLQIASTVLPMCGPSASSSECRCGGRGLWGTWSPVGRLSSELIRPCKVNYMFLLPCLVTMRIIICTCKSSYMGHITGMGHPLHNVKVNFTPKQNLKKPGHLVIFW
jgi:hypothetical protein